MKTENSKKIFIIAIIALVLIIIGLILYIFLNTEKIDTSNNKMTSEVQEEISSEQVEDKVDTTTDNGIENDNTNHSEVSICTGTYYGETKGTLANGLSYDYKYKYILNENGTFTANFGESSMTTGFYTINDNTISFISKKETTGPRDQDPYYKTSDYIISDDCSYILINDGDITFKLMRQ